MKKLFKRKTISILLAMMMLVSMSTMVAFADETTIDTEEALTTAVESATADDVIKLDGDITLSDTLVIDKNITLELNDHILTGNDETAVIQVLDEVTFTLTDEGAKTPRYWDWATETIIDGTDDENTYLNFIGGAITGGAPGVYVGTHEDDEESALFIMKSGNIVGNEDSTDPAIEGGGVGVYSDFEMYGGAIIGNQASLGAGVYIGDAIHEDLDFIMYGGRISGNINASAGGGIYVNYDRMQIKDGEISYNEATDGGGIFLAGSELIMDGGIISYNTATGAKGNGGGISHTGSSDNTNNTFTMNGGEISHNTAYQGGGVLSTAYTDKKTTTFTMNDGEISYNEATGGGGGGVLNYATFNMLGGEIINNESRADGGGVYNYYYSSYGACTFTMRNCTITGNNTKIYYAGGVYYTNGAVVGIGENVTIKDNTTDASGYTYSNLYVPYVSDWSTTKESVPFYILEDFSNPDIGIFMHQLYKNKYALPDQTHVFTVDYDTYKGTDNPMQYFTSDIDGYVAILDTENTETDEVNEVCLTVCYDITFEENNNVGDTDVDDQIVINGETATEPDSDPTKADVDIIAYTFDGWYTSADSGITLSDTAYDFATEVTSDITLYAKWEESTLYTVIYDINGGTSETPVTAYYAETDEVTVTSETPTRTGYVFTGWLSDITDDTTTYQAGDGFTMPSQDVTLTAQWSTLYAVIYDLNGGTSETPVTAYYTEDDTVTVAVSPTRSGYTFKGWSDGTTTYQAGTTFTMPSNDVTLTAQWSKNSSGSSSSTTYYNIEIYITGEGTVTPNGGSDYVEKVAKYGDKTFTFAPADGYELVEVIVDGESLGVIDEYTFENVVYDHYISVIFENTDGSQATLNRDDHIAYMQGYPELDFRPSNNITRAEATVMFSRLLTETMDLDTTYSCSFSDMTGDEWYANNVGYMEQFGIVEGYTDGTFGGDDYITRAEFATIASRFDELAYDGENDFTDVLASHWAIEYINSASTKGWINGYEDGTFKPEQCITRAEAVTLVNRVLDRYADMDFIEENIDEMITFPDVYDTYWAYDQIFEATNGHDYVRNDDGTETWTALD